MAKLAVSKVTFDKEFRTICAGRTFKFDRQITVVSGDNGSGKSSLIEQVNNFFNNPTNSVVSVVSELDNVKCSYVDLAGGLLKTLGWMDDDNFSLQVNCLHKSHGQAAMTQMFSMLENFSGDLLIIDEPERGLSLSKVIVLGKHLKNWAAEHPDVQIIMISHSFDLMRCLGCGESDSNARLVSMPSFAKTSPSLLQMAYIEHAEELCKKLNL